MPTNSEPCKGCGQQWTCHRYDKEATAIVLGMEFEMKPGDKVWSRVHLSGCSAA